MPPESELREWTVVYLKTRDILPRKIERISEDKNKVSVLYKNGKREVYLIKGLRLDIDNATVDDAESVILVCYNTRSNLNFVILEWNKLVNLSKLKILFVNPASRQDKRWVLIPYLHHKIADPSNLERGLNAIFETVGPVVESDAQKPGG